MYSDWNLKNIIPNEEEEYGRTEVSLNLIGRAGRAIFPSGKA